MASKGKKSSDIGIPPLVEDCIEQIRLRGLHEDGILRVSGSAAQIKELQNTYKKGKRADLSNVYIHTVGGVLKNYFRDLPKPIMTYEAYDDFLACAKIANEEERLMRLRKLVKTLPMENQEILHKILVFVREVSQYSDENQMTVQNLATMFGPTLLRKKEQDRNELLGDLQDVIAVTHFMLANVIFEDWPEDQDRHPLRPEEPVKPPNKNKQKKVRTAVTTWYGSEKWEKAVKLSRNSRRKSATPMDGASSSGSVSPVTAKSAPAGVEKGDANHVGEYDREGNGERRSEGGEEEEEEEPEESESGSEEEKPAKQEGNGEFGKEESGSAEAGESEEEEKDESAEESKEEDSGSDESDESD